jgi:hypothetical protein
MTVVMYEMTNRKKKAHFIHLIQLADLDRPMTGHHHGSTTPGIPFQVSSWVRELNR